MTAKRFYLLNYNNYPIYDSLNDKEYNAQFTQREKLCLLLNELAEENNEFKINEEFKNKAYSDLLDNFTQLKKKYQKSKKENKELKRENDILIKQRLGEERLKQEIADYHTSNGRLHRLNNELIRRLDEFHIGYSDILREFE